MKIVIVADIHGNHDALRALPDDYGELWVLGDLVNYGPEPREVVETVMASAAVVVRGNHDHAVAHDDDSRWSSRYRAVAEATRRYTSSLLGAAQKGFLRGLPLQARIERERVAFHLTHARPSDPLHGSCPGGAEEWVGEVEALPADVLLVGHTHVPFMRRIGDKVLLNPGSLGQPRAGSPEASYAVWQDGRFEHRSFRYPVEATVEKLRALAFPPHVEADLVGILRTGSV
jgi:putative phosphoesterase